MATNVIPLLEVISRDSCVVDATFFELTERARPAGGAEPKRPGY